MRFPSGEEQGEKEAGPRVEPGNEVWQESVTGLVGVGTQMGIKHKPIH